MERRDASAASQNTFLRPRHARSRPEGLLRHGRGPPRGRRPDFERPRIAVAALNPDGGEGGNFGREEIDLLEPAVRGAAELDIAVEGPFPSDTVFLWARSGDFDAVLTMYHHQGQIAMKLMGFERGVTLIGGFAFPICTPAHGTAYDNAERGDANIGVSRQALLLAARMAQQLRRQCTARQPAESAAPDPHAETTCGPRSSL
jgi:4-hydroxythreonine-4-phosphate dehydrogenase